MNDNCAFIDKLPDGITFEDLIAAADSKAKNSGLENLHLDRDALNEFASKVHIKGTEEQKAVLRLISSPDIPDNVRKMIEDKLLS